MKNKKTLGFILLVAGGFLATATLLFSPVVIYGVYLLLEVYRPEMEKTPRIVNAIAGGIIIAFAFATLISFLLY